MRILMSGFTATHVLSPKRQIMSTPSTYLMFDALQRMGHRVEARPIRVGEDLSMYHRIIIGLAPPNALNAKHVYGALYAIHQMWVGGLRGFVYLNDWNVRTTMGGFRSQHNCGNRSIFRKMLPRDDRAYVLETPIYKAIIKDTIKWMAHSEWPMITLLPIFSGGDVELVTHDTPIGNVATWDPTPLYPIKSFDIDPRPMRQRERAWVLGALSPQERWVRSIQSTWTVKYFGCRSLQQERVPEHELVDLYCQNRGVLSHRYYHSGAGWWRTRFLHAAMTRSVMHCDIQEGYVLGPAYMHSLVEIERMSTNELTQLAAEQRKVFWRKTRNPNKTAKHLDNIVRSA